MPRLGLSISNGNDKNPRIAVARGQHLMVSGKVGFIIMLDSKIRMVARKPGPQRSVKKAKSTWYL